MRLKVTGYKLNDYNANYEEIPIFFEETVVDNKRRIKVSELDSGRELVFSIPLNKSVETPSGNAKRNKFKASYNPKKIYHENSDCKPNIAPTVVVVGREKRKKNGI